MQTKLSPYKPITPELAACGLLIPLKEAAVTEGACEGTLKANAQARRLRAYQSHFGAPVMVHPDELEVFLKSRPDIASKRHPKGCPASTPPMALPQANNDSPFIDAENPCGPVGDHGIGITLRSLGNTTPSQRALVSKCLIEVARQIMETVPTITEKSLNTENHYEL